MHFWLSWIAALACVLIPVVHSASRQNHASKTRSSNNCSWNTCNEWSRDADVINVHIVPHTHDDLGWIKTVDQYFFGTKPELVPVGVQFIYNTVIDELAKDPSRRFAFAETGFLSRWMRTHNDFDRHRLHSLVAKGQVELIGGGWVQNDEAAAHYVDVIDQMELGLKYLDLQFGDCGHAQTAWQIDPFGHSREVANLFAMMGYTSLFFARIHYLEKAGRLANKSLEFVWNTSDDLKTNILTGAFYQDNYGPPEGFCFDALCGDDPIQDVEDMEGYNLPEKLDAFVAHVRKQAAAQRTRHVMLLMGSDFQYANANMWYTSLDKIIRHLNDKPSLKIHAFYSTPTCYVKGVNEAAPRLPSKNDDFFPYASSAHSFWTGYFSSRPTFKRMIRESSATVQIAKQLDAIAFLGDSDDGDVEVMKQASALAQHHDAVTGTAKENVTRDYERRLAVGMHEMEAVINDALAKLTPKNKWIRQWEAADERPAYFVCPLLNETVCAPLKGQSTFAMTIFNARIEGVTTTIRVPYYSRFAVVKDGQGQRIQVQIGKTFQSAVADASRAPYELLLPVSVPPLGFATYFVDNTDSATATSVTHAIKRQRLPSSDAFIENQHIRVLLDDTGRVKAVVDKDSNMTYQLSQEFLYYEGNDNITEQTSGAYVFRPKTNEVKRFDGKIAVEFSKGGLSEEVRQTVTPYVSQSIRLYNGSRDIEFAWTVGPIPQEETGKKITKEVITRYTTTIQSGGIFYTDANGRQLMKRQRNFNPSFTYQNTEPIAANYYPVTSSINIVDGNSQLTVLTDRSQGASSTADGVIDVMLHRRCFYDDHWGVEEALDEPGTDGKGLVATGIHILQIGKATDGPGRLRIGAQAAFHQPFVAFALVKNVTDYTATRKTTFAGLRRALPPQVHVLTLSKWRGSQVLLRLEHIFQSSDNDPRAAPVTVDLADLFTTFTVTAKSEVLLAGIRKPEYHRKEPSELAVTLYPMEIRTFILDVVERE